MHRFFSPSQNISGNKIILLDKAQTHYLKDVLRIKISDNVVVFDDKGNEYNCSVKELLKDKAVLEIKKKIMPAKNEEIKITVACAIPKKAKIEEIIDKLTQLGVDRVIPLLTERVIVKIDKEKEIKKLERWRKIALSTSQQCQRNGVPAIEPLKDIKEVLAKAGEFDLKLIPALIGRRKPLKDALAGKKPKNILILIGPEGDFTPWEVALAVKAGCIPVSLGNLVLRVDTAAIAAASFIRLNANR